MERLADMLRHNPRSVSANSGVPSQSEREDADTEALRAAYQDVVTTWTHSTFSSRMEPSPKQQTSQLHRQASALMDLPDVTLALKQDTTYQLSAGRLPAGEVSQWLPEMAQKRQMQKRKATDSNRQLSKLITHKSADQPEAAPKAVSRAPVSTHPVQSDSNANRVKKQETLIQSQAIEHILDTLNPMPETAQRKEQRQQSPERPMETATMPDMLNLQSNDDENLPSIPLTDPLSGPFPLLSRPKFIACVISVCLLASTIYAGLGYWWLTGTDISQAAEPQTGAETQSIPGNERPSLKNIETLQNNIIVPDEQISQEETLLAQAAPMKTFTMNELKSEVTGPTGRPDPFSPLIQEGNGMAGFTPLDNHEKKKDILTALQYTGFIGDVNSKDKVAIIKINDSVSGSKTLIKKTGDSFYVDGERVFLKNITKSGLALRVNGANRTVSLNPYQDITPPPSGSNASAAGQASSSSAPSMAVNPGNTDSGSSGTADRPANPVLQEPGPSQ